MSYAKPNWRDDVDDTAESLEVDGTTVTEAGGGLGVASASASPILGKTSALLVRLLRPSEEADAARDRVTCAEASISLTALSSMSSRSRSSELKKSSPPVEPASKLAKTESRLFVCTGLAFAASCACSRSIISLGCRGRLSAFCPEE